MHVDTIIENGYICSENNPPFAGSVGCTDGKIVFVGANDLDVTADKRIDAVGNLIMPGMIDAHVHIGHGAPHADEFLSEGRSAIIGGVTSFLTFFRKFPFEYLKSIPELIKDGRDNCPIDFGVHIPLYTESNLSELSKYRDLGIGGFKFFPGIAGDDAAKMTDLPHTGPMLPIDDNFVLEGLARVNDLGDSVALYHAENPSLNHAAASRIRSSGRNDLQAWCDSRPAFGEAHSVRDAIWWQRLTGVPLYLVHLSSEIALRQALEEKTLGPAGPLYVETCPQFLVLTRDSQIGTVGKMSPPFRTQDDCDALWDSLASGGIDTIASDHGAFRREEKADAWGGRSGFPGMSTTLPVLITHGLNRGRITAEDICRVYAGNPARIFGLYPEKGGIAVGSDADIVVVDTKTERVVDPMDMHSRSDFSIFEGELLAGWPTVVMSRGEVLLEDGELTAEPGRGKFLNTTRPTQ